MTKTAPSPKNRKKFDIDLQYGKVREKLVADMLQDKKIEVKSERDVWQRTGNIAIEYECYGKPSGINATESDYWFHNDRSSSASNSAIRSEVRFSEPGFWDGTSGS